MTNEVKIDRETAAKINPLISSLWTEDTLANISSIVYELGYIASSAAEVETANLFHLFAAIAAALQWETDNIRSVTQARQEMKIC